MKSNKVLFIAVFIIISMTGLASSSFGYDSESLGVYKSGETVNLIQTCENCTYINITTLSYPNSTSINSNEIGMTNTSQTDYFYSLNHTSPLGVYLIHFKSDEDGVRTTAHAWFEVTQTGYKQTTAQGIGSMIYLFLMVSLTIIVLFIGFKLTSSDVLWVLGVFMIFISMFLMTYDFWLGYEYQIKYAGAAASTSVPEIIFYLYLSSLGMGLLVAGILLFKRLPDLIKWFKVVMKKNSEDGWDNDRF